MAKATGVPATRIGEIVRGRRAITAETALRLAAFFDNSPQFWMNLQTEYDLRLARQSLKGRLAKKVKPLAATIRHPVLK
jgi:addiction module HigA family antidote